MASIEFINKRIAGKEKEISKLEKKLERIEKAEATGWEVNPYYYDERDKRWTLKDLEAAHAALDNYKAELQAAQEKAASRDVEAILTFLENWKARVYDFYSRKFLEYQKAREEWDAYSKKQYEAESGLRYNDPVRKQLDSEYREARKAFNEKWDFISPYVHRRYSEVAQRYEWFFDSEKLRKELVQEANAKYDDIIERTNEITGIITDASALSIGEKGELNGYIIGERGTAKVHTIGAGGYNIQCFHFRTLIHKQ